MLGEDHAGLTCGSLEKCCRVVLLCRQVARDCGFCPLALAIAGSMPVVEGHGPSTQAWKELHEHLMNKEEILRKKVGAVKSISHVLDASFDSLGRKRQNNMMSMAVLPKGAAAPMGMLLNLWEIGVSAALRCSVRIRRDYRIFMFYFRIPLGVSVWAVTSFC